jgi:hypothetical protein
MPIVKWKRGEFDALKRLLVQDRPHVIPMVEVLDDSIDLDEDPAGAGAPSAYDRAAAQLKKAWGNAPFFIDTQELDVPAPSAPHPLEQLFAACRQAGLSAVPVTGLGCSQAYNQAVARVIGSDGRGCALRLDVDDLVVSTVGASINGVLGILGAAPTAVDLVLDWRAIDAGAGAAMSLAAAAIVPTLPHVAAWRSVVFAASSFPAALTGVGTGLSTIARAEWAAYRLLLAQAPAGRALSFGDYAIAYPVYAPAPFLGSASIRYTITDDWLIVRGRSLKGPVYGGFGQFQQLCGQLVANPAYCGQTFSWGDEYIDQCSIGQVGTGNLTTWRSVGTNHHITFVARQLASYRVPSTGLAPPPVGP